ncbi:MAG: hypothetical protein Q9219_000079 [cf. Caloplaca sp. 3 TL-2023]
MPSANPPGPSNPSASSPHNHSPKLTSSKPISISLGGSRSNSSQTTKRPSVSSTQTLNPRKRPHSSLNDGDSDSDTEARIQRQPELVSAFDHSAGGAIGVNGVEKAKEPLVIKGLKNRNWREESRRKRGKNLLPAEVQAQRNGAGGQGTVERDEVSLESGLQFTSATKNEGTETDGDGDVGMTNDARTEVQNEPRIKTADEEALEALMGDGAKKSTLVVPMISQSGDDGLRNGTANFSEEDQFRSDVASRPDSATLDDYARVPVEEFGLGMLRGMGWKEGEVVGKRKDQVSKARVVERRPALLGIGAKEVPGVVGEELGAWGKAAKGKSKKVDMTYNPVLLKNNKTGEMLTEDELQAKKERQKEEEREWSERRDKNLAIDEEKKNERRRREKERAYEEGASRSRRRERSRSSDSRYHSSRQERSRSSEQRKHGSSRRERSSSVERRRHSRRRDVDDHDRREKDRRRREKHDGENSVSSRHSHRPREEYDDTRRRRHEVY